MSTMTPKELMFSVSGGSDKDEQVKDGDLGMNEDDTRLCHIYVYMIYM